MKGFVREVRLEKPTIFISYSHQDEAWKDKLLPHLGSLLHRHDIEIWHDRTITTGSYWQELIERAIDRSVIAVLLVSADFLSSGYIRSKEIPRLLKEKHERGLRILPIIIKNCVWQRVAWLSDLGACMFKDRPLVEASEAEVDAVFARLCSELDDYLESQPALPTPPPERTNLSVATTSFVGRQRELKEVEDLLMRSEIRLVSLIGSPGIGKTRLSRQLGRSLLSKFPGGCWFANMIDAVTVTGIAHAIAQAFNFPLASGQMSDQDAIVGLLKMREPLVLILDNFEQVVEFAAETVSYWLEKLPNIKFLVTSREILNLSAEHEYRLDSLPTPPKLWQDPSLPDFESYESVKLFVDRAQQVQPSFRLDEENSLSVAQICRELQGIPLAIELAAARIRVYTPAQIAHKLGEKMSFLRAGRRDQRDRQQTLFGSIDWSFQLLKQWEQSTFLQICIFRGNFFLEAAESIVDVSAFAGAPPVYDVVQSLCEKSLLNAHQTRYGLRFDMYVAIQDYGQEMWGKSAAIAEQEALANRWASFYISYAQEWSGKIHSAAGIEALDRLGLELENLFGIQDWFLAHDEPEIAAHAILAFAETMAVRGPALLRVPRLEKSLARIGEANAELRGRLMSQLSAAHWSLGQWSEATELADQASDLVPRLGCSPYAAAALRQQGRVRADRGYLRRAIESLSKAKEIYQQLGNRSGISVIDGDMAGVFDRLGDLSRSLSLLVEAEEMALAVDDEAQLALVLNRRGLSLWHHGHVERALTCFEEAERINQSLGAAAWVAAHRTNQGLVLADLDEFEAAFNRFQSAEKIHCELGNQAWAAVNYGGWGRALLMRGQPGDLEIGIDMILKAEELSRRVYYPENISLHAGDKARGLFLLGRMDEARKAVREAVALERIIGARKDLRHLGNLIMLARIEIVLAHEEECREAAVRARNLQKELGIDKNHRVRRVREDIYHLEEVLAQFSANESFERRISKLLAKHGLSPLSPAELQDISDAMERASDETSYEYPWYQLEEELKAQGRSTIRLFGYGSLLNRESAARTFTGAADRFIPAIAFGTVRLFNFEMPDAVRVRYGAFEDPLARGLLNARVTGFMSDIANGVVTEVSIDEIEPLREREVGYDLRPVVCIDWERGTGSVPRLAYILSCPDRLWRGKSLTNSELKPHPQYFLQCLDGASSFSPAFSNFWMDTTFLAGGERPVERT